jgi:hypothetical protein
MGDGQRGSLVAVFRIQFAGFGEIFSSLARFTVLQIGLACQGQEGRILVDLAENGLQGLQRLGRLAARR